MARLSRRSRYRQNARRMGSALLVIVLSWTVSGVPLPTGNSLAKRGELFPCSTCKCGCTSAEQCWKSCCCHTLAERLAWARKHGVKPPAFALAEASSAELAEARSIGLLVDELAPKICCTKKQEQDSPSCCKKSLTVASSERSCCRKHKEQSKGEEATDKANNSIVGWRAMKCQGQAMNWLGVVPIAVAARLAAWSRQLPCVAWLGPARSEHGEGVAVDPAVPPPERV